MSEAENEQELTEPGVADVPEPDQDAPGSDDEAEAEAAESPDAPGDEAPDATPDEGNASNTGEGTTLEAAPVDDKEIERQFKALVKERDRHANRIQEIMGEDALFLETCPRCTTTDPQRPATPGFIWPPSMVPLLPEDKAAVKLSIGEGIEPEWKAAEDASRCPKCDGRGKVKTGSTVQGQERLQCLDCKGRGWIGAREHRGEVVPVNNVPDLVLAGGGASEPQPQSDPWGRLKDDPLYGVMPGFERD